MTSAEPSLAEQLEFFKFQLAYWKARALAAEGKQPAPATPEMDTHRRISYRDSTGDQAAARADRTKGNHHGKAKQNSRR